MKNKITKVIMLTSIFVIMLAFTTRAQNISYKVHALFLFKFTQYIEWPSSNSTIVIGVVGNSPIMEELQSLANTGKNITIKKLSASSDMDGCQVVFISENSSTHLSSVSAKVSGKPILLISETGSGAKKGAGINFIIRDDKMKFELNKSTVERQGLKVSGDLVKLSIIVG